jgi:hypothetical protein
VIVLPRSVTPSMCCHQASRSLIATGSSQCGHNPPMSIRRQGLRGSPGTTAGRGSAVGTRRRRRRWCRGVVGGSSSWRRLGHVARGCGLGRRPGGRPVSGIVAVGCGGNRHRAPGSSTAGRGMSSRHRYARGVPMPRRSVSPGARSLTMTCSWARLAVSARRRRGLRARGGAVRRGAPPGCGRRRGGCGAGPGRPGRCPTAHRGRSAGRRRRRPGVVPVTGWSARW